MTQENKVAELLATRYKVIADYPGTDFDSGEIVQVDESGDSLYYGDMGRVRIRLSYYPHLFKKLEWWHDRKPEDLPKFIGYKGESGLFKWVHPIVKWEETRINEAGLCVISFTNLQGEYKEINQSPWSMTPATKSDYDQYIKQNI